MRDALTSRELETLLPLAREGARMPRSPTSSASRCGQCRTTCHGSWRSCRSIIAAGWASARSSLVSCPRPAYCHLL